MKRVLIITYYWPPSGGSGVQRWLKYSKYLPEYGWQPVIYTPENPEAPATDESLLAELQAGLEIIKRPILEPYSWYKWLTGRRESVNVGFTRTDSDKPESRLERTSRWIRGNFFIPDARKLWIRPSVRFLDRYIEEHPVDAIISTGPPHSMHMIGMQLAKKTGRPWIADFRDPWTGIDFYAELLLTKRADRRHHQLEREVLSSASVVTTVSDQIKKELISKGAQNAEVIPNGFDPADFEDISAADSDPDAFTLVHSGSLVPSRNPAALWEALGQCIQENPEFGRHLRIKLVGSTDGSVKHSLKQGGLEKYAELISYLPHSESLSHILSADVLLLLINNTANSEGFLSGKVFEYLACKKPILCIGPVKGDAARLLSKTGAGATADFSDVSAIKQILLRWFDLWKSDQPLIRPDQNIINSYSRKKQAQQIAALLTDLNSC